MAKLPLLLVLLLFLCSWEGHLLSRRHLDPPWAAQIIPVNYALVFIYLQWPKIGINMSPTIENCCGNNVHWEQKCPDLAGSQCVCVLLPSCYAPPARAVVPYNAVAACRHPRPHHHRRHHGLRHCQLRGPLRLLPWALGQSRGRGGEAERNRRRRISERIFRDEQQRRRGWRLPAACQARRWRWLGWWWSRWGAAVQSQHWDTSGQPLSVELGKLTSLRMYAPTFFAALPSTQILTIRHCCCW